MAATTPYRSRVHMRCSPTEKCASRQDAAARNKKAIAADTKCICERQKGMYDRQQEDDSEPVEDRGGGGPRQPVPAPEQAQHLHREQGHARPEYRLLGAVLWPSAVHGDVAQPTPTRAMPRQRDGDACAAYHRPEKGEWHQPWKKADDVNLTYLRRHRHCRRTIAAFATSR
eukprot:CAMPEP_0198510450 /NCGR_PEP_ID=MMETSP1462-20131121/14185_1 /TAXON_ID=1333877 /ORGANISM="Brandtodinium nutriculum, Strain RCC3387" /LENGTH=170 /DNA_ID=CAMNT_0044239779 /DNA_START=207 /DNA_END=717 /DNA_ORIENTATION=+